MKPAHNNRWALAAIAPEVSVDVLMELFILEMGERNKTVSKVHESLIRNGPKCYHRTPFSGMFAYLAGRDRPSCPEKPNHLRHQKCHRLLIAR
jgi:hypothetical protein